MPAVGSKSLRMKLSNGFSTCYLFNGARSSGTVNDGVYIKSPSYRCEDVVRYSLAAVSDMGVG